MPATVTIEGFAVIGIEGRTNNSLESKARGIIPGMWGRLSQELPRIPNRADADVIALYTDYALDEHGDYSFLLGARVTSIAEVPDGMVGREAPAGRYAIFTSERGPLERMVPETWQRIWTHPRTGDFTRSFRTDFELYDTRAADPTNGVVDVYIGLK